MSEIYRIKFEYNHNINYFDRVDLIDKRLFISGSRNEDNVFKKLNTVKIDKNSIQDSSFYRYPKLTLPRMKIDVLKEKFNISITRAKDKADYRIISYKYLNSLSDLSWSSIYSVKDVLDFVGTNPKTSGQFCTDVYNRLIEILKDSNDDDFVEFNYNYSWYTTNAINISNEYDYLFSNYTYIKSQHISDYNNIIGYTNLVLDDDLNNIIYDDLHVLTKEEYNNCRNMLKSDDLENRALALEMLANCNLNKSFDYVSMLYYFYYDYMKDAKNWNNVNVKTLRNALSNFNPMSNMSYGHFYNNYLQQLVKVDQLTEFAFKECARYVFHNVVKRHMGMDDNSVFKIDIDAIQINPKYLEKLKTEHDFFLTDVENAVMKF